MMIPPFNDLAGWGIVVVHLAAGVIAGLLYFRSLWWSANLFATGGRGTTMLFVTIARFSILAGILILVSLEGAAPLLATALGVLVARFAVMRRVRTVAP